MKKKTLISLLVCALLGLAQQQSDMIVKLIGQEKPTIAVPDLRGSGGAQALMSTFNGTLYADLETSGVFKMAPKTMYPTQVPQRPQDFQKSADNAPPTGLWLTGWANPPVNANYLTFGYAAESSGQFVLYGWLYNVKQPDLVNAQMIGKTYLGALNDGGARKVAHEFASDILKLFGVEGLFGTKIFFISARSGTKELWSMDYDGQNEKQVTFYKTITTMPSVAPDGSRVAFTSYLDGLPKIVVHSTETNRRLPFFNQEASMNSNLSFAPDGKHAVYSSSVSGHPNLYIAEANGGGIKRLTSGRYIDVEAKVNPKTGTDVLFISGRGGPQQLYRMSIEGTDVERLSTGEGQVSNPSWHPNGSHVAFSWTRGFEPGNFNVFIMDIADKKYVQLTHGAGRNENPSWAPDGRHIAFASNRSGSMQIYSMLADGSQVRQLTKSGRNEMPVWSK